MLIFDERDLHYIDYDKDAYEWMVVTERDGRWHTKRAVRTRQEAEWLLHEIIGQLGGRRKLTF